MPSSTIDNAISSTKSFIESFTSSDNPTTTFTEHTVASITHTDSIITNIINFISQPKFKWYFLGLLLCIITFIYFKFQNKKPKTTITEEQEQMTAEKTNQKNVDVLLENRDKEWINKINTMKQQFNMQLAVQSDINAQLISQLQTTKRGSQPVVNPNPINEQQTQKQQTLKQQIPRTIQNEKLTDTSVSEEIFIEDKNVMEHNLTAEEMNAIDKQLEDVNLDHLMHASE